ncbi:putative oxidoreductase YkvO [Planotetraspora silvatica]|uniref:Putative oxidoreductase YkvO n=1 Tax=Planotetraspora silvatica TaxID=234614 RepID=A0A8J3XRK7_9ACTN|nr:SDR family oxidoreductase [Planotetraspora silvatica]GII50434.1 putative oxidoreductase YkvO [Planotetraspora silvatica]
MSEVLAGKAAVITGGSTGIGLATARRFLAEGASVVIAGRRQTELDKAVAELGGDVLAVQADVSDADDLDHLYARVRETRGRIDILFANASILQGHSLGGITEDLVDRHLDINVKGLVLTVEKALPLITDGGAVIVTSSVDGVKGGPGRSVYAATKAAGRNLVRSWMQELSDRRIRVNAVSPGRTETPGLAALAGDLDVEEFFGHLATGMPGGRNIQPDEVAAAVTFLASDDASGINGIDLPVDGGFAQI